MSDFETLGLSERAAAAARGAGFSHPSPLQSAALPVLRRGGNVVLHASSGAGVTLTYGLPLLDRLAEQDDGGAGGLRALVLAATPDRAERIAEELAGVGVGLGVAVRAALPGWQVAGADMLVTTVAQALEQVQGSVLKLESVQALVMVDVDRIFALGAGDALGTVAGLVPGAAQRVLAAAELTGDVERFAEAQARRALTVPARPADPQMVEQQESAGQLGYMVVAETEKADVVARLLAGVDEEALIYARTAARADALLHGLERRGVAAGSSVRALPFDQAGAQAARVISADVPFSAEQLKAVHETGGTVLVTAAELPHLRRLAREVPFTLKLRRARPQDDSALDAYRSSIRAALETEDIAVQLLMLEPLFDEYPAAEVAAALSALVRRRAASAPAAGSGAAGAAAPQAAPGTFTRLFVSVGSRDNIRPGDLVGAITGEAGIRGDQVGRVDIRDTFSVVEVSAAAADKVIRALNGTTMRGRSLRVDFDRKAGGGGAPTREGPRGGGGPRGPSGLRGGGGTRAPGGPPRRPPGRDPR